jgi:hypothetical protein
MYFLAMQYMLITKALDSLSTRASNFGVELVDQQTCQSSSPLTSCRNQDTPVFSGGESSLFQSFFGLL